MKFQYQGQSWEIERATESPYRKTVDCRLPKASAEELARKLSGASKIELLGIRSYRDHVWHQHLVWGFRIDGQIVEIAHRPDLSIRRKFR